MKCEHCKCEAGHTNARLEAGRDVDGMLVLLAAETDAERNTRAVSYVYGLLVKISDDAKAEAGVRILADKLLAEKGLVVAKFLGEVLDILKAEGRIKIAPVYKPGYPLISEQILEYSKDKE